MKRILVLIPFLFAVSLSAQVQIGGSPSSVVQIGGNPNTGGGVQYNPPTTAYVFLSFSGLYDDNRILSSAVPVSNFTCTGGTCTVNTSSAHNLGAGSFVDMTASATPFTSSSQQPMTGSFKVLTILTSTQFTFAYSSSASCSSSCGNIYDASYWAIYQAATQPFLNNHGTVYGIEQTLSTVAGAPSTYINCSLGTGGAPTYLIIEAGQDDINGGASAASIETYLQTIWTYAHNNGCNVIQGSITPANYGGFPTFDFSIYQVLNEWLPLQNKNFTSSSNGQYWDKFIDYNSYFYWRGPGSSFTLGGATSASYAFGQRTNEAFSSQSSNYPNEPPLFNQGDPSNGIQIDNTFPWYFNYATLQGTGTPANYWMTLNCCNAGEGLNIYSWFGYTLLNLHGPRNGDMCHIDEGRDTSTTYNSGLVCFNYISDANNANYMHFNLYGTGDILRLYGTGVAAFPSLPSLPSSGTVGLLIDHNGNISTGASGSSPLTTKGDLYGYDTANDRIPVGTNGQVLTADSTQALGLKWATPGSGSGPSIVAGTNVTISEGSPCSSGTCTVNASGGGGYQPTALNLPPASSSLTWINQGGASVSTVSGFPVLQIPEDGTNFRFLSQSNAYSTPYSIAAAFSVTSNVTVSNSGALPGLYLTDGTKFIGIICTVGVTSSSPALRVQEITNVTTQGSVVYSDTPIYPSLLNVGACTNGTFIARWRNDGTNIYADVSPDGLTWTNIYSQGTTSYLSTPTGYAFGGLNASSSTSYINVILKGWLATNSAAQ